MFATHVCQCFVFPVYTGETVELCFFMSKKTLMISTSTSPPSYRGESK